jgi:ubiquinone biosynthesis protein
MRFIAFIRLFKTIFNKKRLPNLAWIEKQGLLFVKIAQTFALRIDFLTPETTLHLQQLYTHGSLKFHTMDDVNQQLPQSLASEIHFLEAKPIGIASIGQVHKATLHNGDVVAIKLINKNLEKAFLKDVRSFKRFIGFITFFYPKLHKVADPLGILAHIEAYTLAELDLNTEIKHTKILQDIKKKYEKTFDFSTLAFPVYYQSLSNKYVLVSKFIEGTPVDQLLRTHILSESEMLDIFRWHGFYMFIVGTFHGDIHPGNIIFNEGVFTLVDTGALSEVTPRIQKGLFEFMKALSRYDYKMCAIKLNEMASVSIEGLSYEKFESKLLDLYKDFAHKTVSEISLTKQMMHTIRLGVLSGMTFEKGMFPIIKSLMYLDGIVLQGAPNMILMEEMRQYITAFEEAKQYV